MEMKGPTWVCILAAPFSDWMTWAPLQIADLGVSLGKWHQSNPQLTGSLFVTSFGSFLPRLRGYLQTQPFTVCPSTFDLMTDYGQVCVAGTIPRPHKLLLPLPFLGHYVLRTLYLIFLIFYSRYFLTSFESFFKFIFGFTESLLLLEGFLCGVWGLLFVVACRLPTVVRTHHNTSCCSYGAWA